MTLYEGNILTRQRCEWLGDLEESLDKLPVIVYDSQEGLNVFDVSWCWPLPDWIDFLRVWFETLVWHNIAQEANTVFVELTFAEFHWEVFLA